MNHHLLQLSLINWIIVKCATTTTLAGPGLSHEVCIGESVDAQCSENSIIVMKQALLGRMRPGRCAKAEVGHFGCATDVLHVFDEECSGKRACTIDSLNRELFSIDSCSGEITKYLEFMYECKEVVNNRLSCQTEGIVRLAGYTSGLILSSDVYSSRNGAELCPWIIQAEDGKQINVTIHDFNYMQNTDPLVPCTRYGEVSDGSTDPLEICPSSERTRNIIVSKSGSVEVSFDDSTGGGSQPKFAIQFLVIGCPDPILRGNILVKREPTRAVVQCGKKGLVQTLRCVHATWSPQPSLCIEESDTDWTDVELDSEWPSTKGIIVVLLLGIGIGAVVGIICMGAVLCCIHRYRRSQRELMPQNYMTTPAALLYSDANSDDLAYNTCMRPGHPVPANYQTWKPADSDVTMTSTMGRRHKAKEAAMDTRTLPRNFANYREHDSLYQ